MLIVSGLHYLQNMEASMRPMELFFIAMRIFTLLMCLLSSLEMTNHFDAM